MQDIYFACLCATYNRPTLLPEAVESFLRQSYQQAELIVFDDVGLYEEQEGRRWKLVVHPERFPTMGAKHDYCIRNLISPRVNAVAIWDDDDISFPNRLEVLARGLKNHDVVVPWRLTQRSENGEISVPYGGDFPIHNGAYRLETYWEVGGYSHEADNWEDLELWNRFVAAGKRIGRVAENIYMVRHHHDIRHVSRCESTGAYQDIQVFPEEKIRHLIPRWEREYDKEAADYRMTPVRLGDIGAVVGGFTQHGSFGTEGALGYDGGTVVLPPEYRDWTVLSAHAASEATIKMQHATEIRGCVDATMSALREDDPILFAVDGDVIGEAAGPWDTTRSLVLPPGKHCLWIDAGRNNRHCHTLWLFRKADRNATDIGDTAFLSVDAFGDDTETTAVFRRSAERHGVPVTFADEGEPWRDFYEHKIRRMKERLLRLREHGIRYVFITDCRDVVFLDGVSTILGKFSAMDDGKAIFNMDVFCQAWPYLQGWYLEELQKIRRHHSPNLNAGLIASRIETMLTIFDLIEPLRAELLSGKPRKGIMERLHSETGSFYANNDQILYQLCMAYYPEYFEIDHRKELFALIVAWPQKPPRFSDDPRRNDVVCNASILHAPGLSREKNWRRWWEEGRWSRSRSLDR